MSVIELRRFEDTVVVHFGTEGPRINAYTLAATLTNLADAAKAANAAINPGYDIEVVVEALGSGSFRATVRAVYREAANLFSGEALRAIVLSVMANFVYQHTLAPTTPIEVRVCTDEVIIEQGDTRIIVPREVHEATQLVEKSPHFLRGIHGVTRAIEADPQITSVGLSPDSKQPPPVQIPRERFVALPAHPEQGDPLFRELEEITDLEILRAILVRSKRRWEFSWNGVPIAAPVVDSQFYDDFFAHRITIAPGDRLRVRLRVRQKRVPDIGIYMNDTYEIAEVMKHIPRERQQRLVPPE